MRALPLLLLLAVGVLAVPATAEGSAVVDATPAGEDYVITRAAGRSLLGTTDQCYEMACYKDAGGSCALWYPARGLGACACHEDKALCTTYDGRQGGCSATTVFRTPCSSNAGRRMLSELPASEITIDNTKSHMGGSDLLPSSALHKRSLLQLVDQCYNTVCLVSGPGSTCLNYGIIGPAGQCTCFNDAPLCLSYTSFPVPSCIFELSVRVATPGQCGGANNDPIINGFNGAVFKFEEVGEFTFFEAEGYKVDATFVPAVAKAGEAELRDKSFTSAVRIFAPNGDHVTCSLPAIRPASVTPEVTAEVAGTGVKTKLSSSVRSAKLEEMRVEAQFTEGDGAHLIGCQVYMPHLDVVVYQVWGSEQAKKAPQEAWAVPFTWFNVQFRVTHRLEGPVTGILGTTYPANGDPQGRAGQAGQAASALRAESTDPAAAKAAAIEGGHGLATSGRRRLAGADAEAGVMVATLGWLL